MPNYKPIAEMTSEAAAIKRAQRNARNARDVIDKPDLTAERRRKK